MAKAPVRRRDGAADGLFECQLGAFGGYGGFAFVGFEGGVGLAGARVAGEFVFDEVGDDFGVGFGDEFVALGGELGLEGEVVFDDAVVDDDEGAGAVAVGVGVLLGGAAVGGPAGVADAEGALDGVARR